jgi:hypothetical protein
MKVTSKSKVIRQEIETRKLGNHCRFLVETKAAFVSKVSTFNICLLKETVNNNLNFLELLV